MHGPRRIPVVQIDRQPETAAARADGFVATTLPHYARNLSRLAADFSAAAAFLLSDPVFERLGCNGRGFIEVARQAYADTGPISPTEVRNRCRKLLTDSNEVLATLQRAARSHQALLEQQRRAGEALTDAAARITAQVEIMLAERLDALNGLVQKETIEDPDRVAALLGEVAATTFSFARQAWEPVFADLVNVTLPPAPLMFSGRQLYIETVKLFNQHRLSAGDAATADHKGIRNIFSAARRPANKAGELAQSGAVASIVNTLGEAIFAAVQAWQRSAFERVQRKGLEGSSSVGEASLAQELALISRSIDQLSALKRELVQGMSVRHYYLSLLRQASGCSRSA